MSEEAKSVISENPNVSICYWPETNTVRFYNAAGIELRPLGDRLEEGETEANPSEAVVIVRFMSDFIGAQNAIKADMHDRKIPRSIASWEELNAVTDANSYTEEAFNREHGAESREIGVSKSCAWCNVLIGCLQKWLEYRSQESAGRNQG